MVKNRDVRDSLLCSVLQRQGSIILALRIFVEYLKLFIIVNLKNLRTSK